MVAAGDLSRSVPPVLRRCRLFLCRCSVFRCGSRLVGLRLLLSRRLRAFKMINLQQLFRAFSRVSSDNICCPFESSAVQSRSVASSAAIPPSLSVAAGVSAPGDTTRPSPSSSVASSVPGVAAAPTPPAAETQATEREGMKSDILQPDRRFSSCSSLRVETMPPPGAASSSLPVSPSCSSVATEATAAVAAAGRHSEAITENFVLCSNTSSGSSRHPAKDTSVQEVQAQESMREAADKAALAAAVLAYPRNAYDASAPASATAALLSQPSRVISSLLTAADLQCPAAAVDSEAAVAATMPFASQVSGTSRPDLLPLGHELSEENNSMEHTQISGSTSCSTSTSSSNSPTTSSSSSPTTSCIGTTLSNSCSNGNDVRTFSLSFSSAAEGVAAWDLPEEFRPLQLSQQHQTAADSESVTKEGGPCFFETTAATYLQLQSQTGKLQASAALTAALAAAEAAKLRRSTQNTFLASRDVEAERLQQQQGVRCVYGEDSSGDSTAGASPACADTSSLLKKPSLKKREEEEEELLTGNPGSCLSAPAAVALAASSTGSGAAVIKAAPPASAPANASTEKTFALTVGAEGEAAAAAADPPARLGVTMKSEGTTAAATNGPAAAACIDCDAATAAPPNETLFTPKPPQRGEAGDCPVWKALNVKSPAMTGSLTSNTNGSGCGRRSSYSGTDSSKRDSGEGISKTFSHLQGDARTAAARGNNADLILPEATTGLEPGATEIAADMTVATGDSVAEDALDGEYQAKDEEAAAQDADEGASVAAEQPIIPMNEDIKNDCNISRTSVENRADVITLASQIAPTAADSPGRDGDPGSAETSNIDSSTCFSFFTNEAAETQESSSGSNRSVTTTDRSRSNTSTSTDECTGTEKCFSAALSADPGVLQMVFVASNREEGDYSEVQPKLQQQQERIAAQSVTLLSSALPAAAAADAWSAGGRLKLLPPLKNGSSNSNSPALLGFDQASAAAAFPSATSDASAAAAVATWLSSLLPQQQLCAAASAALLPGLLLQHNISSANSLTATASAPPANTASSPASEEGLPKQPEAAAAKEQPHSPSVADSPQTKQLKPCTTAVADSAEEANKSVCAAAATRPMQETNVVDAACQEQQQHVADFAEQQVFRTQQQAQAAVSGSILSAAEVLGVDGSKAGLLNVESDTGCLAATTANVSPASVSSSSSSALSGSPSTAATCTLPASVLPPSLLLSSAAEAPLLPCSLPVLSSLSSAVTATENPVVAAVTRSLDAAAQNTLAALPASGASAAASSSNVRPSAVSAAVSAAPGAVHKSSLGGTLPSTPVLAAATAGTLFRASSCSSMSSPLTTASTTAPSSLRPLAAVRSAAGTPPLRSEQTSSGGLQQVHQPGKGLPLADALSPCASSPSSSALSLSSFPSSSIPPSFTALAVALQADAHNSSCLLPSCAAKATPSPLHTNANYAATAAALLNRKDPPFPATATSHHPAAASSVPAASASVPAAAASSVEVAGAVALPGTGSTTTTVASALPTAAAAVTGTPAPAGTPAAGEKQTSPAAVAAASPFSRLTVSASALTSSSSTPVGGPAISPNSSSSVQVALPLTWHQSSAASTPVDVTASTLQHQQQVQQQQQGQHQQQQPQQQQQQLDSAEVTSNTTGKADYIGATVSPGSATAARIPGASAVDLSAGASLGATAVGVSPFGGVIDNSIWSSTAQQLLLQIKLQQQMQQQEAPLNNVTLSSAGAFLPHLCVSPLAAATAVDSSARPSSLNRMQLQQQVAAAAAARTAALLQAAAAAAAASGTASAHNSNFSGLLAAAAAMKEGINTAARAATAVQNPVDSCRRQQQQWLKQTCGFAEAAGEQANSAVTGGAAKSEGEQATRKDSHPGRRKNTLEQQISPQQNLKKTPAVKKQQDQQLPHTRKQSSAEGCRSGSAVEGPPVKRARRAAGGHSASSGVESSSNDVPNSSNIGDPLAAASSGFVHLHPVPTNTADATAALKNLEQGTAAMAGKSAVFASPATAAANLAGMQQQLLAQLQQNQLLLQSAAAGGDNYRLGSLFPVDAARLSGSAVAAPAAAAAGMGGASAAVHQGIKYFVESLSRPSVAAFAAVAATPERGAATFTPIAASPGPVISALLNPRTQAAAATALGSCLPTPTLLPEVMAINNSKQTATAATVLQLQTLQQLQRLQLQAQQQQPEAGSSAGSLESIGCPAAAGFTAANLRGKGSFPSALAMQQQQQHSSLNNGNTAVVTTGGKTSCSNSSGMTTAAKEGRRDTSGGASSSAVRGGTRQQQQRRTQRQEQQQRQQQQQRLATNLQRQDQSSVQQGVHQHHPGVCYSPPKDVWRARITVEGRQHEQQFSVKRHGFEEARLLAVQWRSQMERLRLGGEGGGPRGEAATGVETGAASAGNAPAKTKGASTGMNKHASNPSSGSHTSSSNSSTTYHSVSSTGGRNVTQYPICTTNSNSTGVYDCTAQSNNNNNAQTQVRLPGNSLGQQATLKSSNAPTPAHQQQHSLAEALTTCGADPAYRNLNSIGQLVSLSNSGYRPLSTLTNNSAVDTSLGFLSGDPLSQMRSLAMTTRHLMHAKNLCAMQQPGSGTAQDNSNNGACSTAAAAVLFSPPLLGFLDAAAAGSGGGSATSAPAAAPVETAACSRTAGDSSTVSAANAPALAAGSQLPAAAVGRSWEKAFFN